MPLEGIQTNNAQQTNALQQAPLADAEKTEGNFGGRSVRQEASPQPRSVKWLAFKNGLKMLLERLRGNEGKTELVPAKNDFGYASGSAQAHVANTLNELSASRPRPKELLERLYLAAGCKDNGSQAEFDSEYQKAMTESLESLPDHQLYRMQQRLGKLMGGYEGALRQRESGESADSGEQRVADGLRRTGDKLAQLRESVDSELKSRGYTVKDPKPQTSEQMRQETVDALGKFGSERVAIGYKGFTPSELQKIETGLNDVREQQESHRSGNDSIDSQFVVDFDREELHIDGEFGMRHVTEELKNIPEEDQGKRLAHVTERLSDLCNGDKAQMHRLSSLLTQTATADAHVMLTVAKEGKYAAIRPPIGFEGNTGIAGDTATRFDVRREDDNTLAIAMRCNMEPRAISSPDTLETIPVDTRESNLSYQVFFHLHNDGRVEVKEGRYNYHLQT